MAMFRKAIVRIIDANFNRCREGLRVVEDIIRFAASNDRLRKQIRTIRHALGRIIDEKRFIIELSAARNTGSDPGKGVDTLELARRDCFDLVYANLQRVKESLRVLEEMFKLIDIKKVSLLKKMRYQIYAVEQEIFRGKFPLFFSS